MKKTILLSLYIAFACPSMGSVVPSVPLTFDDAVRGTGMNQHNYVGAGWIFGSTTPTFYNSTLSASKTTGAYMIFTFEGSKLEWFTEKKNTHGIVAISIDGGAETLIDLYSSTEQHLTVYTSPILAPGVTHTFKMRITGTKNPASSNYYGIHDYVKIYYDIAQAGPTNTSFGEESFGDVVSFGDSDNSAFGYRAIAAIDQSSSNTAVGANALPLLYQASYNTAVGSNAMGSGAATTGHNTAVGFNALSKFTNAGGRNTAIGAWSGTTAFVENTTALGWSTVTTASNQVRIGNSEITSIGGQVSWSTLSDGRFKKDVRKDVSGLEFIKQLQPVSYTVDNSALRKFLGVPDSLFDSKAASKEKPVRQTGFVAQEVDKLVKRSGYIFGGIDAPKNDNDPYTVRYAEFVVPLVKAVQELSALVAEQQEQLDQLLSEEETTNSNPAKSSQIHLYQNNPNPYSANTEIKMILPEAVTSARVIVYNLEGKQLKELNVKARGSASVTIMGNELSAGMYIYALIADGKVVGSKRMILTK